MDILLRRAVISGVNSISKRFIASEATFQTKPYKLHKMTEGPSTEVKCTRDEALKYYKDMVVIRRLEAAAGNLYKEKAVRGFCHLYSGQEAVCVGLESAITKDDAVITAYRAHGWTYIRGVSAVGVLAELTGRQSGCAKGKGGSMHMYCKEFYGGNGIVGAQVPLGAGIALAKQYLDTKGVCLSLYGDGAANQGQCFEAYNMAKLWNLPCIFICENNGYGMGTSAERASACTDFYTRGDYVPGMWIDGMDVLAVRNGAQFLVDLCRQGKGPFVVEVATYRYQGHSMSDPGTSYRSREEIQEVRHTRDPITHFRDKIVDAGLVTSEEVKKIEADAKKEIDEAVAVAKSDSELPLDQLYADVYVNPLEQEIRGLTPYTVHTHQRIGKPINIS